MKRLKNAIKSFKLSSFLDFIFFNLTIFLISFAWIKFLTKRTLATIFICIVIVIIVNLVKYTFSKRKRAKAKGITTRDLENCMLCLMANEEHENYKLFTQVLSTFNKVENVDKYIIINKTAFVFNFNKRMIYQEDVIKDILKIKNLGYASIYIFCYNFFEKDKVLIKNLKDLNVKICEKDYVYSLFIKSNIFPKATIEVNSNTKIKFKQLLQLTTTRDKAKKYFFSGLLVFFCSLIVRYNIFYICMSSIMFVLSIICRTKKEEVKDFFS